MILTVGGIKGGTGKTTIATSFAAMAAKLGYFVLLVDADEQESATTFAAMRNDEPSPLASFTTIRLTGMNVRHEVLRLANKYTHIIIDTGGRDTTSQRAAIAVSDRFLVPFAPRCFDVWTVGQVNALVAEMRLVNPNLQALACLNRADPPGQGTDNQDAYRIITDEAPREIEYLSPTLGNRKAFAHAATRGMAVTELPGIRRDPKACQEIITLYQRCFELERNNRGDQVKTDAFSAEA